VWTAVRGIKNKGKYPSSAIYNLPNKAQFPSFYKHQMGTDNITLRAIEQKLVRGYYKSVQQFHQDMLAMFSRFLEWNKIIRRFSVVTEIEKLCNNYDIQAKNFHWYNVYYLYAYL